CSPAGATCLDFQVILESAMTTTWLRLSSVSRDANASASVITTLEVHDNMLANCWPARGRAFGPGRRSLRIWAGAPGCMPPPPGGTRRGAGVASRGLRERGDAHLGDDCRRSDRAHRVGPTRRSTSACSAGDRP